MLTQNEKRNLAIFLNHAKKVVLNMYNETKYGELKIIYARILNNLNTVPINIYPGLYLNAGNGYITYGENIKKMDSGTLKSAIRIPHDHLFDSYGNITSEGAMTLLHEMSHVILPESAEEFRAKVGL